MGVRASAAALAPRWTAIVACAVASACSLTSLDGLSTSEEAASAGCKVGETLCNAAPRVCVDVKTSNAHCGACGAACDKGRACLGGVCSADPCATCVGTCADGKCQVPFVPTTPIVASTGAAAGSCEVGDTSTGRKVAVDDGGALYALMKCGTKVAVAVSTDGAKSFASVVALEMAPGVSAILGGPAGTAWIATAEPSGVSLSMTTDAGASWSAPRSIGAAGAENWLGLVRLRSGVLVGTKVGSTARILRTESSDASAFEETSVPTTMEFGDLLVDPGDSAVWLVGDAPDIRTHRSTDGAKTFGPETSPTVSVYYSDWALGGGTLFALGTGSTLARLSAAAPKTNAPLTNMRTSVDRRRSLSAWSDGTLYVGTQGAGTGATLMRVPAGATVAPGRQTLSIAGTSPAVLALSDRLVFVTYGEGESVLATIQEP